jgi:hypothetical protein
MKHILLSLALICTSAFSYTTKENPHEYFDLSNNNSNEIAVSIIPSDNVQATCDAESKKRGYGGFKMSVEACSFWDKKRVGNKCTIVLPRHANFHTVGHEMRHCMQGSFHK